jgi:hypothetical protein
MKSPRNSLLLQSNVTSVREWCIYDLTKLSVNVTTVTRIYFSKNNQLAWLLLKLYETYITRTESIQIIGVIVDSKLNFHKHADHVH